MPLTTLTFSKRLGQKDYVLRMEPKGQLLHTYLRAASNWKTHNVEGLNNKH